MSKDDHLVRELRQEDSDMSNDAADLIDRLQAEFSKKTGELAECRRLLREALAWPVVTTEDFTNVIMTEAWRQAARAAGGDDV
jgi:ABC-type transporter MlaC component